MKQDKLPKASKIPDGNGIGAGSGDISREGDGYAKPGI